MNTVEILAPCGNIESFNAAVDAGANAVYLGFKRFSARGSADNFNYSEIRQAVEKSRLYGVKVYVAMNTLIFDDELDEFSEIVAEIAQIGVDAVIVQDLGAASLVKEIAPNLPLHGSTQMTVTSADGVKALKKLGFSRVVLARELSRREIREIAEKSPLEIEVFVHGAHCVSVSGQCYMSSLLGGSIARSGNRGMCAQPCRLEFFGAGNSHALSLKDLSLINHIPELVEMGVKSLKIEGRMKRPEYVAAVVSACRAALNGEVPDTELLKNLFSRGGFTDGYFVGDYSDMRGIRSKEDVAATSEALKEIKLSSPVKRYTVDFYVKIKAGEPASCVAAIGDVTVEVVGEIPEKAINRAVSEESVIAQLSKLGGTIFAAGKIKCEIDQGVSLKISEINRLRRKSVKKLEGLGGLISDKNS